MPAAPVGRLALHFVLWSLLSFGGTLGLLGDMQRYLVLLRHWVGQAQFNASLALAQASPGPNIFLFSALLGWHIAGWAGALAAALGLIVPSTLIVCLYTRYHSRHPRQPWLRAFREGVEPISIGLLLSSGWLLASHTAASAADSLALLATVAACLRSRIHPLWLLAAGAAAGALGWL